MTTTLEKMTSGDGTEVYSGSWDIIRLRDTDELDGLAARVKEIREKTKDIDFGRTMFDNNEFVKFAIRKLQYHIDRAGCLCRLYTELDRYDPEKEEEAGYVRVESAASSNDGWSGAYVCGCVLCGSRYEVEYQGGYHYPWWRWRPLTSSDVRPDG